MANARMPLQHRPIHVNARRLQEKQMVAHAEMAGDSTTVFSY